MKFKLMMTQKNLDKVVAKMQKGELIDVASLNNEDGMQEQNEINFVDLYVRGIALKYPLIAGKFNKMKNLDKLALMNRIKPVVGDKPSMHNKMKDDQNDYMGDPVQTHVSSAQNNTTDQVLRHYGDPIPSSAEKRKLTREKIERDN